MESKCRQKINRICPKKFPSSLALLVNMEIFLCPLSLPPVSAPCSRLGLLASKRPTSYIAILLGIGRICYGNCPVFKVGFKAKKKREKLPKLGSTCASIQLPQPFGSRFVPLRTCASPSPRQSKWGTGSTSTGDRAAEDGSG